MSDLVMLLAMPSGREDNPAPSDSQKRSAVKDVLSPSRRLVDYAPQIRQLLHGVIARGIAVRPLLRGAGLSLADVPADADDGQVLDAIARRGARSGPFIRLLGLAKRALDDEFFGRTEHRCRPGTGAMAVEAALRHETLEAALRWMARFYDVVTDDLRLVLEDVDGTHLRVQVRWRRPELDADRFLADFWLLWLHRMLIWLAGQRFPVQAIERRGHLPGDASRLAWFVGGTWRDAQPHDALVLDLRHVALPVARTLAEWRTMQARGELGELTWPEPDRGWSLRVRAHLLAELAHHRRCPSLPQSARELGASEATLRRRLAAEQTTFQGLLDDLRLDMARQWLRDDRMSVAEVGARLGFAEARSFTRAFTQWTGRSPRAWLRET